MRNRNADHGIGRQMGLICRMTYHDPAAGADHALGLDRNEMFRLRLLLLVPVSLRLLLLFLHLLLLLQLLKLLEL